MERLRGLRSACTLVLGAIIINHRSIHRILLAVFAIVAPAVWSSNAAAADDGLHYINAMKDAITEVIDENQDLINKTPDGQVKSKKLLPKAVYRRAYGIFKKIVGADFTPKSLKGEQDPKVIAHYLACLLQAGRITIAKSQGDINGEPDGAKKLKKFIPAVFGRLVSERFEKKTGVQVKQTTMGKGGYGARNAYNQPDDWEKTALAKIVGTDWELNKGFGETVGANFRYIKPIYIKKACLTCHGVPAGEVGPYGHPKEGYKVGEVRGGISIKLPTS